MDIDSLILELQKDQDYQQLEKYEWQFKQYIKDCAQSNNISAVISTTHKLGLMLKYKPYGVKCANILGFSIFLLNPGEGFSFQQHLDFKTELFHFIHVPDDGYGFIAESDEFNSVALQHSIQDWWTGKHTEFDKFKLSPQPGHIAKVSRTGVVHTAIGCILEEYANTSTDMVQRLFDQNAGRDAQIRNRADVMAELHKLRVPFPTDELHQTSTGLKFKQIETTEISPGVQEYLLHDTPDFYASRISVGVNSKFDLKTQDSFVSLFTSQGGLQITNASHSILLQLAKTETVTLPPRTEWSILAQTKTDLSVLKIHESKAFYE